MTHDECIAILERRMASTRAMIALVAACKERGLPAPDKRDLHHHDGSVQANWNMRGEALFTVEVTSAGKWEWSWWRKGGPIQQIGEAEGEGAMESALAALEAWHENKR